MNRFNLNSKKRVRGIYEEPRERNASVIDVREGTFMLVQLHTPIPVETPLGDAFAHLVFDYGQEHYLHFVCFLNETGECWMFDNREIRLQPNLTMGVRRPPAVDKAPKGKKLPKPRRNNPREQREIAAIADWRENGVHDHASSNGREKKRKG